MTNRGAKEGDPSGLQVRVTKRGDHQLCLLANLQVGGRAKIGGIQIPPPRNLKKWGFGGGTLALTGNLATRIP